MPSPASPALSGLWSASNLNINVSAIPLSIIVLTAGCDLVKAPIWPTSGPRCIQRLPNPFRNFLRLDDVSEENGRLRLRSPRWKMITLVALPLVQVFIHIAVLAFSISASKNRDAISTSLFSLAWLYASCRVLFNPPTTPPYSLLAFYTAIALSSSFELILVFSTVDGRDDLSFLPTIVHFSISACLIYVTGTFPMKDVLPSVNVAGPNDIPTDQMTMPEDSVTLWQWCTFSFMEPVFKLASLRRLEAEDVWKLSPFFTHRNLFNKYLNYRDLHPNHSLIRFLITSNLLDLTIDIVSELYKTVMGFVQIYGLQRILTVLSNTSTHDISEAYHYAFVMFIVNLSFAQVDIFKTWHSRRCYERSRGQLFCALHYKALRRRDLGGSSYHNGESSDSASDSADLGKIVNLMHPTGKDINGFPNRHFNRGDAYTVSFRFWQSSAVFSATIRLVIALLFLHSVLGWSSMAGVVVVAVAYLFNYPLGKYSIYVTRASYKARDIRLSSVNELFQNIRFLKFYGWENHWATGVSKRREAELRWRVKDNIVSTIISFIWIWVPSAMALFSFLFYTVVGGGRLTVSKTFTALALFSALQGPMMELPAQVFAFLHAYVSMQRINGFLREEEVPSWASTLMQSSGKGAPCPTREIGFRDATFHWYTSGEAHPRRFELGALSVSFPRANLSLVTGATGSGKSALLAALLGELRCVSGEVMIDKSKHQVAYCAQNPWLEHATIRDNIVFGARFGYQEDRYNSVIHACALTMDLDILEAGDLTEIGEKGVTLSGGQRARVALARAIYSEANCILLDDPLSAVDMHTAQHIVEHCLRGELMRNRTVVLVTHHISLCLPAASFLVELSGGRIIRQGTIKDLQSSGQLKTVIEYEDKQHIEEPEESDTTENENEADSVHSGSTLTPQKPQRKKFKANGKLVEAEARAEGRVSLQTYLTYVKAAGWISWVLILVMVLLMRVNDIANDLFLAKWSMAYENKDSYAPVERSYGALLRSPLDRLPSPQVDVVPWLIIYLTISLAVAFSTLAYISLGYYAGLQAGRKLFMGMLLRLIRAPSRFFDVTPVGRILNRFTADMSTVDSDLQSSARAALTGCLTFLASFLFIVWVVPPFTPFAIVIAWLYVRIAPRYIRAARDLRRLESVSLSPAFSGFDELLRGLSHVRAFGMENRFQEAFYKKVDAFQGFDHVYWLVAGWLRWRYDCLGSVVVYVSTLFALWLGIPDGFAAIVIVQAGVFAEASRQLVRVAAQLELDFNSVERIGEYLQAPQEAPPIINEKRPPAYWPSDSGPLIVEDLVVRYSPELPPVLNGLSFTVHPGEKIGVVGRTGSGKSTLALSLLRIVEPSGGKIILDGIDITTIGLEDLRTRITIVSQDVSLFSGTIRSNLDPFGEHEDHECWDVLERCHLVSRSEGSNHHLKGVTSLDSVISSTGSLSAGERQLVALARAILRRSQVVIMDEATSQIDVLLDDQIQQTMRQELKQSLVITIAHRLKTIIDYDRIMVIGEGGRVVEMDTPKVLFEKQGGAFREMCRRSADWDDLQAVVNGEKP